MQQHLADLNDRQRAFVRAYVNGVPPVEAAAKAGYAHDQDGPRLLRQPSVVFAVRVEVTRMLAVEAAPLAYRVLRDIAKDANVPPAVRRMAARDLLDRAGFVAPKAAEMAGGADKPLSEMTSDELRTLVDRLEGELGARAVDVSASGMADNTQALALPAAKPLSFLD